MLSDRHMVGDALADHHCDPPPRSGTGCGASWARVGRRSKPDGVVRGDLHELSTDRVLEDHVKLALLVSSVGVHPITQDAASSALALLDVRSPPRPVAADALWIGSMSVMTGQAIRTSASRTIGIDPLEQTASERGIREMAGQKKLYRAGQTRSAAQGGGKVSSGTQQGTTSKSQGGKTHAVKNRSVNHGRNR